jgi:hypothetical protein
MRRRRAPGEILFSLDSFLDIVTNVVGVLVLVAIVTVLSSGNISVPFAGTAMQTPGPSAERALFECVGGEIYFVDEEANGRRVLDEVTASGMAAGAPEDIMTLLDEHDVGDETFRVRATRVEGAVAWVYALRPEARGEDVAALGAKESSYQRRLAALPRPGFAYFVVHDDSFDVFKKARDLARARGLSVGWHPVAGRDPLRIAANGSLGRRVQ